MVLFMQKTLFCIQANYQLLSLSNRFLGLSDTCLVLIAWLYLPVIDRNKLKIKQSFEKLHF